MVMDLLCFLYRLLTRCEDCGYRWCVSWIGADPERDHRGVCGK